MKTMRFPTFLILSLLTLTAHAADGFKPLYNGKDLSGWHVKDSKFQNWMANGEILLCKKGEIGITNGNGWLTTDKEYGDFVLQLEWKIPANGNTGPPEPADQAQGRRRNQHHPGHRRWLSFASRTTHSESHLTHHGHQSTQVRS